jgi:hypothetical protein
MEGCYENIQNEVEICESIVDNPHNYSFEASINFLSKINF